ncbi:hypothetical protein OIO90_004733 [Microbotryomycetes sp. JL221]|nr:hypothetical protein OIO90_004733 [Microbotryomycetes sp. JL221]
MATTEIETGAQSQSQKRFSHSHTYRGHRRQSWVEQDTDWLVELRARQRTFDGAYIRTAMGNFGYALLILKVFTAEFARIGLLYVILAVILLLVGWRRANRSDHDFADEHRPPEPDSSETGPTERPSLLQRISSSMSPSRNPHRQSRSRSRSRDQDLITTASNTTNRSSERQHRDPIDEAARQGAPREDEPAANRKTAPPNERIWGRPFRTSGNVVVSTGLVVTGLYAAIFALIMRLS